MPHQIIYNKIYKRNCLYYIIIKKLTLKIRWVVFSMSIYFIWWRLKTSNVPVRKEILPVQNNVSFVLFIDCSEIVLSKIIPNGLRVSLFIEDMEWYLGVIGRLSNKETLMYLFTVEVTDGTPIFRKTVC